MKYSKGYKYQLKTDYTHPRPIFTVISALVELPFIQVDLCGIMTIRAGYAWDGASGPTVDCESSMTPSLVHDAGYQLGRSGYYAGFEKSARKWWDDEFYQMLCDRDFNLGRAYLYHKAVRHFAARAFDSKPKAIIEAY